MKLHQAVYVLYSGGGRFKCRVTHYPSKGFSWLSLFYQGTAGIVCINRPRPLYLWYFRVRGTQSTSHCFTNSALSLHALRPIHPFNHSESVRFERMRLSVFRLFARLGYSNKWKYADINIYALCWYSFLRWTRYCYSVY